MLGSIMQFSCRDCRRPDIFGAEVAQSLRDVWGFVLEQVDAGIGIEQVDQENEARSRCSGPRRISSRISSGVRSSSQLPNVANHSSGKRLSSRSETSSRTQAERLFPAFWAAASSRFAVSSSR